MAESNEAPTVRDEEYAPAKDLAPAKSYTLKPVVKPLPSKRSGEQSENPHSAKEDSAPQFRDITEDDDGYHPYADLPDTRPLFEENPWD